MAKKYKDIYMPKGKKTIIKEIKLLENNEILINGKEYVILETTENIETAKTMKVSSNGNRILRFDDEKKKARIDVKRSINIVKVIFKDEDRAKQFSKKNDKKLIQDADTKELIDTANSFIHARAIVANFKDKENENYDKQIGITTFYLFEE